MLSWYLRLKKYNEDNNIEYIRHDIDFHKSIKDVALGDYMRDARLYLEDIWCLEFFIEKQLDDVNNDDLDKLDATLLRICKDIDEMINIKDIICGKMEELKTSKQET